MSTDKLRKVGYNQLENTIACLENLCQALWESSDLIKAKKGDIGKIFALILATVWKHWRQGQCINKIFVFVFKVEGQD